MNNTYVVLYQVENQGGTALLAFGGTKNWIPIHTTQDEFELRNIFEKWDVLQLFGCKLDKTNTKVMLVTPLNHVTDITEKYLGK